MGLDSMWRVRRGKEYLEIDVSEKDLAILEAHPVCGGLFSGHGAGSFRGKVYNDLVENLTGQSLYQEYIPPGTIQAMAEKLGKTSYAQASSRMTHWRLDPEEYRNLQKMFEVYARYDAGLVGWW